MRGGAGSQHEVVVEQQGQSVLELSSFDKLLFIK